MKCDNCFKKSLSEKRAIIWQNSATHRKCQKGLRPDQAWHTFAFFMGLKGELVVYNVEAGRFYKDPRRSKDILEYGERFVTS